MLRTAKIHFLLLMTLVYSVGCGPNPYKSLEKQDPAEEATIALENDNAQKAIDILTRALDDDPGNQQFISILALAYAQRAGVDPLTLAQNMGDSSGSSSGNGVTALFGIMPPATLATIADVDTAVALLLSIPTAELKSYDILKLAMFTTAAMTLRAKILDTNGDGILSTEELLAMTAEQALSILTQLATSASAFSTGGTSSSTDQAASEQVSKIQDAINAEEGADATEKLRSYLGKSAS